MNLENQFSEEIAFAKTTFGFVKMPVIIPTNLKRVSIGKLGDEWFAGTPGKIEMAHFYGRFDRLGRISKILRFIGNALRWRWLYEKGRFTAYGEPLILDIVTITLNEYSMPTGHIVSLGYDAKSGILAIGHRRPIAGLI